MRERDTAEQDPRDAQGDTLDLERVAEENTCSNHKTQRKNGVRYARSDK